MAIRTLLTRLVLVLVLAAALVPALPPFANAGNTVVTSIGGARVEITFNDPVANDGQDITQLNKLISLFDGAPAGSTVRIGLYSITANIVGNAIERAVDRGVRVYVVHSGHDKASGDDSPMALVNLLGSNHRWCDHGNSALYGEACISNSDTGLMHAKYVLFSQTRDSGGTLRSWATWFGSANMTYASGANLFNNSFTIYGDQTLYNGFYNELWLPQWGEQSYASNDFYCASCPRGYFGSSMSNTTVYASPEQTTDLVVNRLSYVDPDDTCRIRVMQASINDTRPEVVGSLIALRNGGCRIWADVGAIQPDSLRRLKAAGISVRKSPVHDKAFIINARYAGSAANRSIVLTGSHNITLSALRYNDEILVKVTDNQTMYDAFYDHFNSAYNTGAAL